MWAYFSLRAPCDQARDIREFIILFADLGTGLLSIWVCRAVAICNESPMSMGGLALKDSRTISTSLCTGVSRDEMSLALLVFLLER
jgi:hypothetical protein